MKLPKYDSTLEETAAHYAGNHRRFTSFAWGTAPDDADKWTIVYTTNRDADALTRSNHEEISKLLEPFIGSDVETEDHSHWAVGWVAGFSVRVYTADGAITPAFKACFEIMQRLDNYPALNEMRWSELETEDGTTESGYCDCACRDCFEIAIRDAGETAALCLTCDEMGCDNTGESECNVIDDNETDATEGS